MKRKPLMFTEGQAEHVKRKILSRCVSGDNGCVEWSGSKNNTGYGQVYIQADHWGPASRAQTHRAIWVCEHGPLDGSMDVDHICGNRACCNVKHLRLATRSSNTRYKTVQCSNNSSGYRNVYFSKPLGKWRVQLHVRDGNNSRFISGGYHYDIEDANRAAIALRAKHYGVNEYDAWKEVVNGNA